MANPFLFNDEELSPQSSDPASNPFLVQENDDEGDNPFLAQNASAAINPFADYGAEPSVPDLVATTLASTAEQLQQNMSFTTTAETSVPRSGNIDSAMSFFGTTITDQDEPEEPPQLLANPAVSAIRTDILTNFDQAMSDSDDELHLNNHPPTRPVPPSKTTQDLILSVSDQMDQASSHLLDRIPVTRTPSPVSMRDLHSPSPTRDFFEVEEGATDELNISVQNPFADSFNNQHEIPQQPPATAKSEPPRPPPPRPTPPRPSPPRRPSPPQIASSAAASPQANGGPPPRPAPPPQQEPDLFDMFGTDIPAQPKKPTPPKSNQDILNLFSIGSAPPASSTPPNKDLLFDDISAMDTAPDFSSGNPLLISSQVPNPIEQPLASAIPPVVPTAVPASVPLVESFASEEKTAESSDNEAIDNISPISPVISDIQTTAETTPPVEKENILDDVEAVSPDRSFVESAICDNFVSHINAAAPPSDMSDDQSTTIDGGGITPALSSANPFASPETEPEEQLQQPIVVPVAPAVVVPSVPLAPVAVPPPAPIRVVPAAAAPPPKSDQFDAFAAKFDSVKKDGMNLLDGFGPPSRSVSSEFVWGDETVTNNDGGTDGFGGDDDGFDSFLAMGPPQIARSDSRDSDDGTAKEFNVVIKPRDGDVALGLGSAILAPPPPRSSQNNSIYSGDSSPRINPFDKGDDADLSLSPAKQPAVPTDLPLNRDGEYTNDNQETPATPLFDEDVSQPLEDFPRITYTGDGWEMQLRQPNKKKITGQRFWKKIFLRIVNPYENPVLQLRNAATDKEPFQELPLQACYSVSDISAQQFDQFGKIFTLKLQYIFYKERPGVRPGQITKAGRLTDKLGKFAAYAIMGDYEGVKEFGSDLKKLGLPVEHAPQVSQLFKLGSHNYEDLKQFMVYIDELLFKYNVHRDRALTYKRDEVQITAVDELYVEQDAEGRVLKQICRVRLFFLGFLSGMPTIELGVNDLWRQGKEVVGRHDIIPVVTEEWIRLEGVEFHSCVQQQEYERSRTIRFQPPDACYIELMRFRVRPPKNRELPFQLKAVWCVTGNKVELRADILVPGFASRKLGQIPCEDVSVRFPIPECWIYLFRVEKHFRYGSVKSAHRRTGKIKGIERILGTVDQLQESLIEVTSGQAKYEHHHRAIVWRCPRLPKEGQGAYTTHQLVVRMALTSYDQIPEQLAPFCYVEFTMPATQVSHMTVRSVSVQDMDSEEPPEKYVRYLARHEYRVGIEHTTGESMNPYLAATSVARKPDPIKEEAPAPTAAAPSDSDSDSN